MLFTLTTTRNQQKIYYRICKCVCVLFFCCVEMVWLISRIGLNIPHSRCIGLFCNKCVSTLLALNYIAEKENTTDCLLGKTERLGFVVHFQLIAIIVWLQNVASRNGWLFGTFVDFSAGKLKRKPNGQTKPLFASF